MKSRHRLSLWLFVLLVLGQRRASAFSMFECVRDLLPITEVAATRLHRPHLEAPFMLNPRFMAFPEVQKKQVRGFYIYSLAGGAWHYDAVAAKGSLPVRKLIELSNHGERKLYDLVAQPQDLETLSISFQPAEPNARFAYQEPDIRAPLPPNLEHLLSQRSLNSEALWAPLKAEREMREQWIRGHNLEEGLFKQFSRLLEGTCRREKPSE